MKKETLSVSEIYAKGKRNLEKRGTNRKFPPDSPTGMSVLANREILNSLFFVPRYFNPPEVGTDTVLFGRKCKTPVFCSPISRTDFMSAGDMAKIAKGLKKAGALMMLGIGSSSELQQVVDTGVPTVKIIKPYRRTEMIYKKIRDAEARGCVAAGMDIDHFYGRLLGDKVDRADLFGPQATNELKSLISQTKLPFIIKGVLSSVDAQIALDLGAAAIIVSNHGTYAIDATIPSLAALPEIRDQVGKKIPVFVDTSFKTGNDVLKGMALGAKAVGLASSVLIAFAADGAKGVEALINQITAEIKRTMAALGCADLGSISKSIIRQFPFRLDLTKV